MQRRLLAVAIAVTMLTVTAPAAAEHLSAGAQGNIGDGPQEGPDLPSVSDEQHAIGITDPSDCYQAEGNIDPAEAQRAVQSEGFCGHIYYNDGTNFVKTSPPDQHYPSSKIGTFDVQRTYYVGNLGPAICEPMCNSAGQDEVWNVFHTAGSAAGLTDGPGTADEERDGNRSQTYDVRMGMNHAPGLVQRNVAPVWDMNGWVMPQLFASFTGFLLDKDGNAIGANELRDMVRSADLNKDTSVNICGYTPDADFTSTGDQSFCDTPMTWDGPNSTSDPDNRGDEDDDGTPFDSYNDHCRSPTYACGPTKETSGVWHSNSIGVIGAYGGFPQDDHFVWHWVVAPNTQDCSLIQPGFDFDGDGASKPYLAHDVDVYTPITDLKSGPTVSAEHTDSYSDAVVNSLSPDNLPGVPDEVEDTIDDATDTVDQSTAQFSNGEFIEPNYAPSLSGVSIEEDSRDEQTVDRSLAGLTDCEKLATSESTDTVDPWVNYIDAGVTESRTVTPQGGVIGDDVPFLGFPEYPSTAGTGVYGTDTAADEDNDPTTDLYGTEGTVGFYTDKNDDGDYDQIFGPSDSTDTFGLGVYQGNEIRAVGAYPMLWDADVEINETTGKAQLAPNQGCFGPGAQPFTKTVQKAGFGPNTGIAQAVYLQEPTAVVDSSADEPQVEVFPGGNNIYVFGSNAVRELWDGQLDDGEDKFAISENVDQLVQGLSDHVTTKGYAASTPDVKQPGERFGLDSDYDSQCGESTGEYELSLSFAHDCSLDCSGDTIATLYSFEVQPNDHIGGGELPDLQEITGASTPLFDSGQTYSWFDVDPFDGDTDRNKQSQRPPTG